LHQGCEDTAPNGVRVELLQGFELSSGSEPVRLPLSAQRLVAFVALRRRPVQRLHVAGSLWLDSSEDQANASLRTALWRLRRARVPVVDASSTRIGLDRDVRVDVHEVTEAAEAVIAGSPGPPSDWRSLVAVGELLADWYDDWVIVERERIRHLQLRALEALCRRLTREGRFAEAVEAGYAAVSAEPLRESAHRVVIEAFVAEGNVCDARRQYGLCRRMLREQLGAAPSSALEQLVGQPVSLR
jgi:DNA-binding SARP family transcriptional activator